MQYKLIDLNVNGDDRGSLVAFEKNQNVPFEVKRAFYIFDTKGEITRGVHANKKSEFLLIVISGSCRVKVDTGKEQDDILLNKPQKALYLNKLVWKEMYEFSHNTVLLVLSNEYYDENEYIRDYNHFFNMVNNA
ncbi:MAG: FdtA/QdtA family cupin domain-containing protein [bacterium]